MMMGKGGLSAMVKQTFPASAEDAASQQNPIRRTCAAKAPAFVVELIFVTPHAGRGWN
jgi:hypothetical protein